MGKETSTSITEYWIVFYLLCIISSAQTSHRLLWSCQSTSFSVPEPICAVLAAESLHTISPSDVFLKTPKQRTRLLSLLLHVKSCHVTGDSGVVGNQTCMGGASSQRPECGIRARVTPTTSRRDKGISTLHLLSSILYSEEQKIIIFIIFHFFSVWKHSFNFSGFFGENLVLLYKCHMSHMGSKTTEGISNEICYLVNHSQLIFFPP